MEKTNEQSINTQVDFEATAKMRIDLAMSKIQQYSSMAIFDKSYSEKAKAWFEYFSEIKALYDAGEFESVFGMEMPE